MAVTNKSLDAVPAQKQTTVTASSSVNSPHKRKVNSTSSASSAPTQSSKSPVTPMSNASTSSTHSALLTHRTNHHTSSFGRTVVQRNLSPKKELPPKKSGRASGGNDGPHKNSTPRNRKQATSSIATTTPSSTRTKKEKLLCVCRTPYDDTKWVLLFCAVTVMLFIILKNQY